MFIYWCCRCTSPGWCLWLGSGSAVFFLELVVVVVELFVGHVLDLFDGLVEVSALGVLDGEFDAQKFVDAFAGAEAFVPG